MQRLIESLNESKRLSELSIDGYVASEERRPTYRRKRGSKSHHIHFIAGHSPVELIPIELCLVGDIHPLRWQEKLQRILAIDEEMSDYTLQRNVIKLTGGGLDEKEG